MRLVRVLAGLVLCLCALAGAAAAVAAVPAAAAPSARLHVAFTPDLAGARTTIELSLHVLGASGGTPPPLRSMSLRLPAGMGIATTTLGEANCDPANLLAAGLSGCSTNALLGFGSATAVVPVGSSNVIEHATLHPLMGPPRENEVEVLFYVEASAPVFAQLVLPGVLAEDAAPYGEQLQTSVPLVEAWPEGPDLALQSITTTIGPLHLTYHRRVGAKTVPFRPQGIRIPRQCPPRGYPFAALLRFIDGTTATASLHVGCPY
ncbi:MAG TPA: hypothetical protein VHS55_03595 [Solirubrobacteraceae bacterium]|jgi:hypothetical protein|nr:hypothetical protein [Solirubrobacteraceae bacterium]